MKKDEESKKQLSQLPAVIKETEPETRSFKEQLRNPFEELTEVEEKNLLKRLTLILSMFALASLITLYIISPYSKLNNITVRGSEQTNAEEIAASSGLKKGHFLWTQLLRQKKVGQNIAKSYPRVKETRMNLQGLNNIVLSIKEYDTVALIKQGKVSHPVLENGMVLKDVVKGDIGNVPLLNSFKEDDNLTEFLDSYAKFDNKTKKNIKEIESIGTLKNPYRVKLTMADGNEVIGLSTTLADKMVFYDKIVGEMPEKGIIDMEAGTSGVFSYPFETESTEEVSSSTEPLATSNEEW